MGRLTKRFDNGRAYLCVKTKAKGHEGTAEAHTKALNRLAELEDKLESGQLVELPCKVGDIVYMPFENSVADDAWGMNYHKEWEIRNVPFEIRMLNEIDTKYFLKKEQAEVRLKQLQEK